jgi:hypothetical protein
MKWFAAVANKNGNNITLNTNPQTRHIDSITLHGEKFNEVTLPCISAMEKLRPIYGAEAISPIEITTDENGRREYTYEMAQLQAFTTSPKGLINILHNSMNQEHQKIAPPHFNYISVRIVDNGIEAFEPETFIVTPGSYGVYSMKDHQMTISDKTLNEVRKLHEKYGCDGVYSFMVSKMINENGYQP